MYLVIGLGNPENEYSMTRHNMGFDSLNKISEKYNIKVTKKKFDALYGTGTIEGKQVVLIKPQTYMNNSGEAIKKFVDFYKTNIVSEMLVIYDDLDIKEGIVKIRKKGGPGTHNGMKSVIKELGTDEFSRIRIGIGKEKKIDNLIEYVIAKISKEEYEKVEKGVNKSVEAIEEIFKNNIDIAMNKIN